MGLADGWINTHLRMKRVAPYYNTKSVKHSLLFIRLQATNPAGSLGIRAHPLQE
jgi:hypothetical protein